MKKIASFILVLATIIGTFGTITASAASSSIPNDGYYCIVNIGTGNGMNNYAGGSNNGNKITEWKHSTSDTDQIFRISTNSGKSYLYTYNGSKVVDVLSYHKPIKSGMPIDIWSKDKSEKDYQELIIVSYGNGYVIKIASNQSFCIAAVGGKNGSQLQTQKFSGKNNQIWKFIKVKNQTTNERKTSSSYYVGNTKYTLYSVNGKEIWKDSNNKQASSVVTEKLNKMIVMRAAINSDLAKSYNNLAKAYRKLYVNNAASSKLGKVVGKGSALLLNITCPNPTTPVTLNSVAIDCSGLSSENVKEAILMATLSGYCQKTQSAYANYLKFSNSTSYENCIKEFEYYCNILASFEAVKYIAGDTINSLAKSSTSKELLKYGANIALGFSDGVCLADKVKKGVDFTIDLGEVATKIGAEKAYNKKYQQYMDLLKKN